MRKVFVYKRFATLSEELEYEQGQEWKNKGVEKKDSSQKETAGSVPKRHVRVADLPTSQREALKKRLAVEEGESSVSRNVFVDGLLPNKETVSRTILSVLAYNRRLDDIQNARDGHSDSTSEEEEFSSVSSSGKSRSSEDSFSESENEDDWASIRRTAGKQLNAYVESSSAYNADRKIRRLRLKKAECEEV